MATKSNTPAVDPAILAGLAQLLGITPPDTVGVEVEAKPNGKRVAKRANGKPASKPATAKRKPAAKRTCNITAREAWEALGADPEFEPRDPDKPASGPMLWRLNANGELAALLA